MTRNVDDSHDPDAVELERREAKIDSYAASFFFGQAISVDPRQCLDQRGLAVINVTGGADNQAALQRSCSHTANARNGRSSVRCAPRNSRRSRWWDRASTSLTAVVPPSSHCLIALRAADGSLLPPGDNRAHAAQTIPPDTWENVASSDSRCGV
jgi:hypothetical protein